VIAVWIILWILAGLLGLVLVLLLVPLGAFARGSAQDLDLAGVFRLSWGFGMIQLRGGGGEALHLRVVGLRVKDLAGGGKDKEADEPAEAKKKRSGPGMRWFLRHRRTLLRVAMRLLGSFRFDGWIRGSFGTGDPAETATAWALLQVVDGRIPHLHLDVTPRYVDEGWDLEGDVRFGVWPIRTAIAALVLLLRRDVRRAMKTART